MAVISSILLYTILFYWRGGGGGGRGVGLELPYLIECISVCDFDRTVNFLSNNSRIIATYAEVVKYNVKFNVPENIRLKMMIPYVFFFQCTYFHFCHYKSMEILICNSNESTWATAIKNIIFVEDYVMNISTKFQHHPPYGFWGDDFLTFFSQIYPFGCHGNQSNSAVWTKFICLEEDYSKNISENLLSKYLQWDRNKGLLSLSYKSLETISCHSDESVRATAIKTKFCRG